MSELAEFLRARRERITPAEVGLADSGRRRTPGLRREEVATLAGVSIDYLVRLEQGRDVNPSPAVLGALAGALRLSDVEKHHLAVLATKGASSSLCPTSLAVETEVPATVRALLDRLESTPSFVAGPYGDILAWTRSWEALVRPLGLLDEDMGNLARFVFLHSDAATVYPDWPDAADDQVSQLRAASVRWGSDERMVALLAALAPLPEFSDRWSAHEVAEKHRGERTVVHPTAGELRVAYEVMVMSGGDQRLTTWLPADARTEIAFDELTSTVAPSSPAQLRVVGDS